MKSLPDPCPCKDERPGDLAYFLIMAAFSILILIMVSAKVHEHVTYKASTDTTHKERRK